jgi:hypothetical protein
MLYSTMVSKAALANQDLKVLAILKCLIAYGRTEFKVASALKTGTLKSSCTFKERRYFLKYQCPLCQKYIIIVGRTSVQ